MKTFSIVLVAGLLLAGTAHAAQVEPRNNHALRADLAQQTRVAAERKAATRSYSGTLASVQAQGFGGVNGPYANPYRAYPPSCMADPLPAQFTGPVYSQEIDAAAYVPSQGGYVREPVTVSVWRVPCSSSGNHPNAITLLRVERLPENNGRWDQHVVFPDVRVAQGQVSFDDPDGFDQPRLTIEPNTIIAYSLTDSPVQYSTTWVLENWPLPDRPVFDYTQAFQVRLDNYFVDGQSQYIIDVPAYQPAEYFAPNYQRINGYMSSAYYDPSHSGEGMMVQVYEIADAGVYIAAFSWYTFGPDGEPFWITGAATVVPGSRAVTVDTAAWADNGGFAGNFGSEVSAHLWGSVTLKWSNCSTMELDFQSADGLPAHVPQGSGSRIWQRLGNINGLTCE